MSIVLSYGIKIKIGIAMSAEGKLSELKKRIKEILQDDVSISGVEFEGPELVIYTEDTLKFVDDGAMVRTLAK
ncbi:MAG: hypothetical protein U9N61_08950, partial [Euryarchaeota archaeon]|nr:hypothetical protein [Euryarchaeota archaeon]